MRIAILGAGAWGTALGVVLSSRHQVSLWGRRAHLIQEMAATRRHSNALPGIVLPQSLELNVDLVRTINGSDLIVIATSTKGLAEVVDLVHGARPGTPIVWVCKGFNQPSGQLPHEIVGARVGERTPYGTLSGPSFALEFAQGLPTALTLASNDIAFASATAAALNSQFMRVYSSADLIGVELGGALKNIMAIAAGICDGMKLGMNARAALITRGLAEMMRLGEAMGGKKETFMGLTGLGDLVLTATGDLSRNRTVGLQLAQGKALAAILDELGQVAEGINTAQRARQLARQHGIEMPITEAVCTVLFEGADAKQALQQLLAREAKAE